MKNHTKTVRITARISSELYKRAKDHGKVKDRSLSYLVGEGLKKIVNKK